jgi:hypothetical protein
LHDTRHRIAAAGTLRHVEDVHRATIGTQFFRIGGDECRISVRQIHGRRDAQDVEQIDIQQSVHAAFGDRVADDAVGETIGIIGEVDGAVAAGLRAAGRQKLRLRSGGGTEG